MSKFYPMHEFNFPPKPADIKLLDVLPDEKVRLEIIRNVEVKLIDMLDQLILDETVRAAQEAGITDLFVLDKKFVIDAIRERWKEIYPTVDNPIDQKRPSVKHAGSLYILKTKYWR